MVLKLVVQEHRHLPDFIFNGIIAHLASWNHFETYVNQSKKHISPTDLSATKNTLFREHVALAVFNLLFFPYLGIILT